jgi:hypothetical protein
MIDDTSALPAVWTSNESARESGAASTIAGVLEKDRAARDRERRVRHGSLLALACLLPLLLWAAAHGVTPLVRGAYALMAAGVAALVSAEWMYLDWSSQGLPGPVDVRSQLQATAFMLARQIRLLKTAPFWTSPVFAGAILIGVWMYGARTHAGAFLIWTLTAAGWVGVALGTAPARSRLSETKLELERLLRDLSSERV